MKCKILFNFFDEEDSCTASDFFLYLNSVNGYYLLDGAIIVIIFGQEYCLLYEEELLSKIKHNIAMRQSFKMN